MTNRRRRRREPRRTSLLLATLLVTVSVAGTAFALTQTTLLENLIELFRSQPQPTNFTVAILESTPEGDDQLTIDITVQNSDALDTHFANVTVNLLNATGAVIDSQTQATGAVAPSGTVVLKYVFLQANIVSNYQSAQIIVRESS